jgi:beta-barrel assembly-enhancing protease
MKQYLLAFLVLWQSSCSTAQSPPAAEKHRQTQPQGQAQTLDASRGGMAERLARENSSGGGALPERRAPQPGAASPSVPAPAPPPAPVAAPAAAAAPGADPASKAGPSQETGSIDELRKARERLSGEATETPLRVESFTEDEERSVGEATARSLLSRYRALPPDAPASIYVRKVGTVLVENSSRPELPYRFIVLEAKEVNAFAAPYGYVFITTGALRFARNEAELAFLLAHEIAHVEKKHGLAAIVRAQLDLSKRSARQRLDAMSPPPSAEEKEQREALEKRMDELSDLVLKGYGLPNEREADKVGLLIVTKAGYDARASTAFLARIAEVKAPVDDKPEIFRSHPLAGERFVAVNAFVSSFPPGGAVLADRYREAVKTLK